MYYWLNGFLGGVLYPYLLGLMWSFLLERRWQKCPVWVMAAILMLLTQPAGLIRSQNIGSFLFQAMGIVQILLMIAFLVFCFQDRLWKKILVFFTFLPCGFIGEFLGVTIMRHFGIYYQSTFASKEMFLLQTVSITIDICFYTVITMVWYSIFKRRTLPRHTWASCCSRLASC